MITVCVATDISLQREGLLRCLSEGRGIVVAATAQHSDQVLHSIRGGQPEVLVLHARLPGEGTAELLRRLIQRGCTQNIILFDRWDAASISAAKRLQISALIDERDDAENFVRAVHLTQNGATYYSDSVNSLLDAVSTSSIPTSASAVSDVLTPTELQILRALGENLTSQEIARSMFISYRTVQKHRSNMTRKLKLEGSNALLAFALRFQEENR